MSPELFDIITTLIKWLLSALWLYLAYRAGRDGWFADNKFKCGVPGCKFSFGHSDRWIVTRVGDDHLIRHIQKKEHANDDTTRNPA